MARKSAMQVVRDDENDENEDDASTGPQEVTMEDAMAEDAALASQEPAEAKAPRSRWDALQSHAFHSAVASRSTVKDGVLVFTGSVQDVLDDLEEHFPEGITEDKVRAKWTSTKQSLARKGKVYPAIPGTVSRTKVDAVADIFAKHGIELPAVPVAAPDDSDDEDEDETDE